MSEYVTFGLRESIDLAKILDTVNKTFVNANVYLWGRDMGAAAIIHLLYDWETQIFIKKELNKSHTV